MLIRYARVSTDEQNTALQIKALKAADVRKIHQESASGAADRPVLERVLLSLKPADVLFAHKVDRLWQRIKASAAARQEASDV